MSAKKQNYVQGAAILAATVAIVKIIGFLYKIPLLNILDDEGTTGFNIAYNIYGFLLTVSTAGVPVAISRMISASISTGRVNQSKRIFSVAMPTFAIVGIVCSAVMMIFAQQLADFMEVSHAATPIFALGPAVFFCCIIAVYRGYSQGHEDMIPTSISQIAEVLCKLILGLSLAMLFVKLGKPSDVVAAGAILGVVIGLGIAIPILARYRRKAIRNNSYGLVSLDPSVMSRKATLKEILRISIPITLSASMLNIISLIDTKVVLTQLKDGAGLAEKAATVAYAAFTRASTLFSLPSSFIVPIAVSVVPAIAAAMAVKKHRESADIMSSAMKITNLFALPAGIGLCVLANPIYNVLFWEHRGGEGPLLLAIMGIASYLVCFQLVSSAMLQATGHEKISMISLPLGGLIKVGVSWVLVGNPDIGILGAPISTIVGYAVMSIYNTVALMRRVPDKPRLAAAFIKPLICSAIMGATAWAIYGLVYTVGGDFVATTRIGMCIAMAVAIVVAVIVYGILIIALGAITKEDMKLVPKGERIAKVLKLK